MCAATKHCCRCRSSDIPVWRHFGVTTIFRSLCSRHVIFLCRWLYCFCIYVLFFCLNFKMGLRHVLQAVLLPLRFIVVKLQAQQCTLADKQGEETSSAPATFAACWKATTCHKGWRVERWRRTDMCSKDNFLPRQGRHNEKKCVHGHRSG